MGAEDTLSDETASLQDIDSCSQCGLEKDSQDPQKVLSLYNLEQYFPILFLESMSCPVRMSPLSDLYISGVGVSINELKTI